MRPQVLFSLSTGLLLVVGGVPRLKSPVGFGMLPGSEFQVNNTFVKTYQTKRQHPVDATLRGAFTVLPFVAPSSFRSVVALWLCSTGARFLLVTQRACVQKKGQKQRDPSIATRANQLAIRYLVCQDWERKAWYSGQPLVQRHACFGPQPHPIDPFLPHSKQ